MATGVERRARYVVMPVSANVAAGDSGENGEAGDVRRLALVGGHAERGVALHVLDGRVALSVSERDVAGGDVVLEVDEGLAGGSSTCQSGAKAGALGDARRARIDRTLKPKSGRGRQRRRDGRSPARRPASCRRSAAPATVIPGGRVSGTKACRVPRSSAGVAAVVRGEVPMRRRPAARDGDAGRCRCGGAAVVASDGDRRDAVLAALGLHVDESVEQRRRARRRPPWQRNLLGTTVVARASTMAATVTPRRLQRGDRAPAIVVVGEDDGLAARRDGVAVVSRCARRRPA